MGKPARSRSIISFSAEASEDWDMNFDFPKVGLEGILDDDLGLDVNNDSSFFNFFNSPDSDLLEGEDLISRHTIAL